MSREPGARHRAGVVSCVVDRAPRFHLEALRWFATLSSVAGVDPRDMVVHVVGDAMSDAIGVLRDHGVTLRSIGPFDARSPHCNKIAGARRLVDAGVEGTVVLCDADTVVLEDPRMLTVPPTSLAAKLVDLPVPPLTVLSQVFAEAGVPLPEEVALPWGERQSTCSGNCNGGLYVMAADLLPTVTDAWEHWARWLLERQSILQEWTFHLDQVAMALGLAADGISFVPLDVRWNTPIHQVSLIPSDAAPPAVLHYHDRVAVDGRIQTTGVPAVDEQVGRANAAIGELWQRAFPNATFWQWRYTTDPELGSGVGSRGDALQRKRQLLRRIVEAAQPSSVLDVGCGDGRATERLELPGYTGIDLSAEAVRQASLARPEGRYLVGTPFEHTVRADLVLCLDVLIHQPHADQYRDLVARLWQSADQVLVISGYDRRLGQDAPMVHFHEPLGVTLRAVAPEAERYEVREEHGITTYVVMRPPAARHPRDFGPETLDPLAGRHPDPIELIAIRASAWRTGGFYPDHAPRLWEYPTVSSLVRFRLAPGSRIVDIGAGVNPLVPYLDHLGYRVDTVDPSPLHRSWPPAPDSDEWGFLDYAAAGLGHASWNCRIEELPGELRFDAAYSVSVIEHLRAEDRRALLGSIGRRVRPGGLVVLTVDLLRDRDDLWNRSSGVEVEELARHGTLSDVVTEADRRGLELVRADRIRGWSEAPVDIGLLVLRRRARRAGWSLRSELRRATRRARSSRLYLELRRATVRLEAAARRRLRRRDA